MGNLTASDDGVGGIGGAPEPAGSAGTGFPGRVRISYVGADRMWAEWVAQQLERAGLVTALELQDPLTGRDLARALRHTLDGADRTLAVFSDAYFQAGGHDLAEWADAYASVGDRIGRLVPVVVGPCRVPDMPAPLTFVELFDLGEEQARQRLLDRVVGADAPAGGVARASEFRHPVRFPGEQPAVWGHVPLRNVNFTGRDQVLLALRERMTTSVTAVVPSAVHGMGGVGKTQLAVEYAYRFASDYDVVWYVRAEQTTLARYDLAALAPRLDLPVSQHLGETVQSVLDALRRGAPYRRWLLIFDNATSPAELRPLLPTGQGHVLVTSRDVDWRSSAEVLEVDVYRRAESVRFLRRRVPRLSEADANLVAERLGDLPLALEAAAAWLEVSGTPVEEYLQLADTQLTNLLGEVRVIPYEREVVMAWAVPMNRLRDERPAAAQLLRLCAFLSAEPIPVTLFTQAQLDGESPVRLPQPLDGQLRDPVQRGRIFHDIGRYALAKVGQHTAATAAQTIQLHRVVQGVLRDLLTGQQRDELRRTARLLLAAADPGDPEDPSTWDAYAELIPHLEPAGVVADGAEPAVRRLVIHLVHHLYRRGEFAASRDLAARAARVWERVLGEHPDLNDLNVHLANALRGGGDSVAAREIDERVLDYWRRRFGPDHERTLWAANGLAADLRQLGEWRAAREMDRDTLRRCREAFGADHENTLRAAHNYAVSLRMMGEFPEALEVDRDTAERRTRLSGANRQRTLLSVNNVARDLRECGRYAEAAAMQENTYAEYRRLFGDRHPDTLRAMKNLSVSLRKAGRYAESCALARRTLEGHSERFPDDHPELLAATTNLANDLRLVGDLVEARARAEHACSRFRHKLGDRHPYTLASATNLAVLLRLSGDPEAARELDELTQQAFRDVLGADHPYTLASATNLASDLYALGDHAAARRLDEDVLTRSRLARGEDHPYTLACASNLAMDLRATNERSAARTLEADTLDRYRRTLGDEHPEVVAATARARLDCDIEPPPM
ncbi:FxSxx-COOH system tetratricopeptide repeat protein [Gandjariella thermophila]|uniref:ATP-binding protein n=1 Tax=Gandjariella thermophila TaxID=1931992 RepID=A0A4D4IZW2_9PSEU|nr:FxSxx-COOH system tetratricopeptide repeat protein [Gandjariella thermophila]GDY29885.1 hypothetical protein GTS_15180 [Gandjariella thermophila]